jgi:hypothetical protein
MARRARIATQRLIMATKPRMPLVEKILSSRGIIKPPRLFTGFWKKSDPGANWI